MSRRIPAALDEDGWRQLRLDIAEFIGAADPGVNEADFKQLSRLAFRADSGRFSTGGIDFEQAVTVWRMIEQLRQNGLPEDLKL